MSVIYVVFGSSGEYSDRVEWPVCAFTSEVAAQERVAAATARDREIEAAKRHWIDEICPDGVDPREIEINQFDPENQCSYDSARYWYAAVEVVA